MTREVDWGDIPDKKNLSPKRQVDWGDEKRLPETLSEGMQLLHRFGHALGGAAVGLAQGGSDIGANIAQFPSDIYKWASGKEGYHAPKPDIRNLAPQSNIGQGFEKAGEFAAPFVGSPALALETTIGKALFGGKLFPRIAADSLLGAAESEDRKLGGALGAAAPAGGKVIRAIKETPLTKYGASKNLNKAAKLAGTESLGIPIGLDFLRNMEYQLQSPHLRPSKMQVNTLMGEAAKGDYPSYFNLQSALGDISREFLHPSQQNGKGIMSMIGHYLNPPQTNAAERLTGQQLNQLRKQYIQEAMEHLSKTGKKKVADLETKGREDFSRYKKFLPLRNKVLLGGAAASIPGIQLIKHLLNHD